MSIHSALTTHLEGAAGITALCSTRIYPVALPQDAARPAMTYQRMSGSPHDHTITKASGTSLAKFRLMYWGNTHKAALSLAEAGRQAMQGFSGVVGGTSINAVVLIDDYDDFMQPQDGSEKGIFAVVHDYHIRYAESIPTF